MVLKCKALEIIIDVNYGQQYVNYLNYINKVNNMQEYWVNVYQYETVKNTQFYSHLLPSIIEANFRAVMRQIARPDSKVVYRIHVKMKPLITIFGVETGVRAGDGALKSVKYAHKYLEKGDWIS